MKIRIALAVDSKGKWVAFGQNDQQNWGTLMDVMIDGLEVGESRYWIEVDVEPQPIATLKAIAEPT